MKFSPRVELFPWLFILLPYTYLPFVWDKMPDKLPIHWNLDNQADNWISKSAAWALPLLLCGGMYVLLWLIVWADPKQKLQQMAGKFHQLKLVMVASFSALVLLIFYYAQRDELKDGATWFIMFQGVVFAALGNFFQSLKPNYFIGIRSPWTLESEYVWRKTHRVFGWVWVIGGLILIIMPFVAGNAVLQSISGPLTLIVLAGLPYLYSFIIWKWPGKSKMEI